MQRRLTSLLAAGALLAAAPAAHAAGWVTSAPLSPPDRFALFPQLAVTPGGERVAAWLDTPVDQRPTNVSARIALAGGSFGPTQTIAGAPTDLQIATAADGTVALAWRDGTPNATTVHFARLAPGATSFVEAKPFAPPGLEPPDLVHIAFSGTDLFAVVGTQQFDGGHRTSLWAVKLPAGSDTPVVEPSAGAGGTLDHAENPQGQPQVFLQRAVIAADGDHVVIAWTHEVAAAGNQPAQSSVEYALRGGDSFGARFNIDTQSSTDGFIPTMLPAVAVGGGHVYVAWTRDRTRAINYLDAADMTPKTIDSGAFSADDLQATADPSGALVVAWTAVPAGSDNRSPFAVVVPPGAAAGPGSPLTPIAIDRTLDSLTVGSDGSVLALTERESRDHALEWDGTLRPPGAGFGAPESITGLQEDDPNAVFEHQPSAFAGPGGQALVLWSGADHSGTRNLRVHLSERDSTPPALSDVRVPATAVAGQPVQLSATATDALSTPDVSWDFGDGSGAAGASVTHAFGAPGAATVTVTARDSAGNVSTQTRAIAVTAVRPVEDATPPTISGITATPLRFRVARGATAVVASRTRAATGVPRGTVVRLRLSERAAVVLTFRRAGRRAVLGTIVRLGLPPGARAIPFSGRIGRTALRPGTYVLTATAIDGVGLLSRPALLRLRVTK